MPRLREARCARGREERAMTELGVVRRKVKRAERAAVEALGPSQTQPPADRGYS